MFLAVSSSLFALNNKYFSVKDSEWEFKKASDKEMGFIMKNYTPEEGDVTGIIPVANVQIEQEDDKLYVVSFSQKELNDLKNKLENKAFKDYYDSARKASKKFLEQSTRLSRNEIENALEEIYGNSAITSSKIAKIGSSKAYCFDFNISKAKFKRFVIPSLHRATVIEFTYPDSFDLESSKAYKDFISSFKNNDKDPSSFNGFIYGGLGKSILRLLIFVIIGVVGTYVKRLRG